MEELEERTVPRYANGGAPARTFETGATRDVDNGKLDYEGFLSPRVLHCYAQYMHKHRLMKDGTMRPSDNWQLGIPREAYMKSLWRHFFEVWSGHRGFFPEELLEEALCAVIFNASGYLHELRKQDVYPPKTGLPG